MGKLKCENTSKQNKWASSMKMVAIGESFVFINLVVFVETK
jgi:hypothetical protein